MAGHHADCKACWRHLLIPWCPACNFCSISDWRDWGIRLSKRLGKLKDNYAIKLQTNFQPYALTTPRHIAIPLLPKVEAELQRMLVL